MDNLTNLLSSLSFLFFSTSIILLVRGRRKMTKSISVYLPFLISLCLYDGIMISNVLEHSGITAFFDPMEDLAEAVFVMLLLFFVHNWRRERSERQFRELFRMAPMALAEISQDGRVLEVNQEMTDLMNACGVKVPKDGSGSFFTEESGGAGLNDSVLRVASGSTIRPAEHELTCTDGSKRTLIVSGNRIADSLIVSMVDISERKAAEAEKDTLYRQLLQAQKLEAVGTLAGGIAHDFNNLLGAIIGYADLCLDEIPAGVSYREPIQKIMEAAQRSSGLTRQLLIFARKQAAHPTVIELNATIENMLAMLRRLIGENIALQFLPADDSRCRIMIDTTHLDQILVNLCVNARDAIASVGSIKISTWTLDIDADSTGMFDDCTPGLYVRMRVQDNGCGMDKETSLHVFEPFYTTKGVGKGTGLGLSTVYGIVKQAGGFIHLYSEKGSGTTFDIYFPSRQDDGQTVIASADISVAKGMGETILLVEDDAMLMDSSCEMLQNLGYTVLTAPTPGDALRIVGEGNTIDLLLTDVIMPEMNGRELANRILERVPGIRYLFMSGYTADVILHQGVDERSEGFIQKPFLKKDIAGKIREVLDKKNDRTSA